jgi:surface protein
MKGMFKNARIFDQDLRLWETSSVTDFSEMFREAFLFSADIRQWKVTPVIHSDNMFYHADAWNAAFIRKHDITVLSSRYHGPPDAWTYAPTQFSYGTLRSAVDACVKAEPSGERCYAKDNSICGGWNCGEIETWDVSLVTTMNWVFANNKKSFNVDISGWNTAAVTSMDNMFYHAEKFNRDISGWNVDSVTTMKSTFHNAFEFNSDISGWNTAAVTDMTAMLAGAKAFNGDISGWNTGAVTKMQSMFHTAKVFNGIISAWNTGAVTNMDSMFRTASSFNGDISAWNTGALTNAHAMFFGATDFNSDISGWNTAAATDMRWMFYAATSFNRDLNDWNTARVTSAHAMFARATSFNGDISAWDTARVTSAHAMFSGATSFNGDISEWNTGAVTNMEYMFDGARAFNRDIGAWDVGRVTSMHAMFRSATAFDSLLSWYTSADTRYMFEFAEAWQRSYARGDGGLNLPGHGPPSAWALRYKFPDRATLINAMNECLRDDATGINCETPSHCGSQKCGEVKYWDVSLVTSMTWLFHNKRSFNADISLWNTAAVTDMSWMFFHAYSFNHDISGWNVNSVTEMQSMFHHARVFDANITGWNPTGKTTSMFFDARVWWKKYVRFAGIGVDGPPSAWAPRYKFQHGYQLRVAADLCIKNVSTGIKCETPAGTCGNQNCGDIELWDVSLVADMEGIFQNAFEFNADIGAWNTSAATNMRYMLTHTHVFNQDISAWNTTAVRNMHLMFWAALTFNQDISAWDVSSVTDFRFMFRDAYAFDADITGWRSISALESTGMFNEATAWLSLYGRYENPRSEDGPPQMWALKASIPPPPPPLPFKFPNRKALEDAVDACIANVPTGIGCVTPAQTCGVHNCGDIGTWDVSLVTDMGQMFEAKTFFNAEIGDWNTNRVTNMSSMFSGATDFNRDIKGWDVSSVINTRSMFLNAKAWHRTYILSTRSGSANNEPPSNFKLFEIVNRIRLTGGRYFDEHANAEYVFYHRTEQNVLYYRPSWHNSLLKDLIEYGPGGRIWMAWGPIFAFQQNGQSVVQLRTSFSTGLIVYGTFDNPYPN